MNQTDSITLPFENNKPTPSQDSGDTLYETFLASLFCKMKDFPYACLAFPDFSIYESVRNGMVDLVVPAGDVNMWQAACLKEVAEDQLIRIAHDQGVSFRVRLHPEKEFYIHLILEEKLPFTEADLIIIKSYTQADGIKLARLPFVLTYILHATNLANSQQRAFQSYYRSLPAEQRRKLTNQLVQKYADLHPKRNLAPAENLSHISI